MTCKWLAACKHFLRRLTTSQAGSNLVFRWKGVQCANQNKFTERSSYMPTWLSSVMYLQSFTMSFERLRAFFTHHHGVRRSFERKKNITGVLFSLELKSSVLILVTLFWMRLCCRTFRSWLVQQDGAPAYHPQPHSSRPRPWSRGLHNWFHGSGLHWVTERSFNVTGPWIWNNLSVSLRFLEDWIHLRRLLKAHCSV